VRRDPYENKNYLQFIATSVFPVGSPLGHHLLLIRKHPKVVRTLEDKNRPTNICPRIVRQTTISRRPMGTAVSVLGSCQTLGRTRRIDRRRRQPDIGVHLKVKSQRRFVRSKILFAIYLRDLRTATGSTAEPPDHCLRVVVTNRTKEHCQNVRHVNVLFITFTTILLPCNIFLLFLTTNVY